MHGLGIALKLSRTLAHPDCHCLLLRTQQSTGEHNLPIIDYRIHQVIMPKAKPIASLSGLIDTDMEDDTVNMEADAFPTPDSNQENAGPAKKRGGRGKATAKKFTKAKPASRRVSSESAAPKRVAPKKAATKRAPLKEQSNIQQAEDTEEVDEFDGQDHEDTNMDELVEPKQAAKRKPPEKKAGRPAKSKPLPQANAMEKDGEFEYTPTALRQSKAITKSSSSNSTKPNATKRQPSVESRRQEKFIPETQVPMDTEPSEFPQEDKEIEDAVPQSVFRRTNNARNAAYQRQPLVGRKRAGSASDTERGGGDPATRRKLGEMTKKFENLELKYKNLRETAIKEADANFAKYKAQSQVKAKGESFLFSWLLCTLIKHSCGRFDCLSPKGNHDAKISFSRLALTPETNRRSRRRSSENPSSSRSALYIALRSTERK